MTGERVIAIDVGGTGIKYAVLDGGGEVQHAGHRPTGSRRGPDAVVRTILDLAAGLAATARASGPAATAVGVVVPGVVDETNGVAVWSANLGFRDVPLREVLERHLGLPVVLGHDVRAGGLAEAALGAGRGYREVLFVAIGTGIAGAHVVGGRVHPGAHGAAGEVGHLTIRPGGPACGCGGRGCLEAVASAAAVARRYAERAGRRRRAGTAAAPAGTTSAGTAAATGDVAGAGPTAGSGEVTAAEVVRRAAAGDPVAVRVWAETVQALSDGLRAALTLYDPEVVVLGGGLAEAGDALLGPLHAALTTRLTFQHMPALVRARLGDRAGCLGAGLLALGRVGT